MPHPEPRHHAATTTVAAGRPTSVPDAPMNTPLVPASTFVAGGEREYGRYGNPTWAAFEEVVGELEGGSAVMFSSGIAAVAAALGTIAPGGRVVVAHQSYAGTHALLDDLAAHGALGVTRIDVTEADAFTRALDDEGDGTGGATTGEPGAVCLWLESPANPTMEVVDIQTITRAAHAAGARVVVDNTFATPLRQRPLDLGADLVVHSATKLLAGHSDALAGVAVARDEQLHQRVLSHRSTHGAVPGILEAYLATRGLRTLAVRLDRAESNARMLAERLSMHPAVDRVRYPGFGTLCSFEPSGGADAAHRVVMASALVRVSTSLGGVESSWERRRRWPAEPATVPEGLIRLSVGIEHVDDLWSDIERALGAA
ncbi:UNVERIFIED_CONTAM: cystathionine gamma-synthase [Mumia flava]|nr:aminotransferase class I/II-fold pyridoxal phosphate-dependent enzyme [Mumia flava]